MSVPRLQIFGRLSRKPLGQMLMVLVLTFQVLAPSLATAMQSDPAADVVMMDHSDHQIMQHAEMDATGLGSPATQDHHDSAEHCAPSICCFHGASSPIAFDIAVVLLPTVRTADYAVALPSNIRFSKDRPPKYL
ncbi:DUF2946 family protein [Roseovarius nanhaiticus]|uniref:DUF2946 family protein n=1 Tax=Roseovarius nanhaiticus TaxID=573024 RepID=UPI0031EB81AE